eukprot:SAG11_NODE_1035_length_6090_cov_64.023035_6_plen_88_part_00
MLSYSSHIGVATTVVRDTWIHRFTEIEHMARELGQTKYQDVTCVSCELQQQNIGRARLYLRDVDPAVANVISVVTLSFAVQFGAQKK